MTKPENRSDLFRFQNSYEHLPERFFARQEPASMPAPLMLKLNHTLAEELHLDPQALDTEKGAQIFSGNLLPTGASSIAMVYAGHQFGNWVPQLGDGRAILLGEVVDKNDIRRDIQLKGAGQTPFSRRGDGRAVLGPVLREYIVSEAMHALDIPTTRALAAVATGEQVMRESVLPGAVLTRVANSHVRVGTFQFFSAQNDMEAVRILADYIIERHYPDAAGTATPYCSFLDKVVTAQATLVAHWLNIGFIHGVMNTDNCSIVGETIDYGPCAFMDNYHPETVFSSIDMHGRYAFGNQPRIAQWNLAQLAQSLLPLLNASEDKAIDQAQEVINQYPERFNTAWQQGMRQKTGLLETHADDLDLMRDLLACMAENSADFTLTFRSLCDIVESGKDALKETSKLFDNPTEFESWAARWQKRLVLEKTNKKDRLNVMRSTNPAFIPRNHRVEEAIQAALANNMQPFEDLVTALANPFDEQSEFQHLMTPPEPDQIVRETFCGT